jgi:tetratricopeptide (TPR) repeat protein
MPPELESESPSQRQPISPAARRRLQQCFEHATRSSSKGDYEYANKMFTQCVIGDPGNLIYLQSFLGNLQRKYNNNKKGGKLAALKGAGTKATIKKTSVKKDWEGLIKAGCEMLALNPWDTSTLLAMAHACEELGHDDCELFYLRSALDANPKDAEINRRAGLALERLGQFDQAISCWHRVQQAKPSDDEAQRMIANLTVSKTIQQGGYEKKVAGAEEPEAADEAATGHKVSAAQLTPQQKLQQAIARDPENIANYLELADLNARDDRFDDARRVLKQALDVSGGGDLTVRERLEDVELQHGRRQVEIAERRAAQEKTDEAVVLLKRIKAEVNQRELEIFAARCERSPSNTSLQYELGVRLKRAGKYNEAIQTLQAARGDVKRKAVVLTELGECFQYIKQYKLAMNNYEHAVEATSDREPSTRKLALYRAGVLAMGLKDWPAAEKYLTELAELDFAYKDVAERLDKLSHLRHKS